MSESNRGGVREGAGRPPEGYPYNVTTSVTEEIAEALAEEAARESAPVARIARRYLILGWESENGPASDEA